MPAPMPTMLPRPSAGFAITPAVRRRLRALATRADTKDGLDRLCAYVEAYSLRPRAVPMALQPDGTLRAPEIGWRDRIMGLLRAASTFGG